MEFSQDDLGRRLALFRHNFRGNTSAVIDDSNRVIYMYNNVDFCAEPSQGLVNGIVDDLINEMMKTVNSSRPDIHRGSLPNRF
jgi:hypothetical protein